VAIVGRHGQLGILRTPSGQGLSVACSVVGAIILLLLVASLFRRASWR
jgi:uncharacterized membrane protein YeaQ/YmgE (transglycosylase-associated protein family)